MASSDGNPNGMADKAVKTEAEEVPKKMLIEAETLNSQSKNRNTLADLRPVSTAKMRRKKTAKSTGTVVRVQIQKKRT